LLFTFVIGAASMVAIVETADSGYINVTIVIAFIVGALLIYGVDIRKIEAGPLKIYFESDYQEDSARLDEFDGES